MDPDTEMFILIGPCNDLCRSVRVNGWACPSFACHFLCLFPPFFLVENKKRTQFCMPLSTNCVHTQSFCWTPQHVPYPCKWNRGFILLAHSPDPFFPKPPFSKRQALLCGSCLVFLSGQEMSTLVGGMCSIWHWQWYYSRQCQPSLSLPRTLRKL